MKHDHRYGHDHDIEVVFVSDEEESDFPSSSDSETVSVDTAELLLQASGVNETPAIQMREENVDGGRPDEEKDNAVSNVFGSIKVPKDIHCDSALLDLQFSPNKDANLLAVTTKDGRVLIYHYGDEENTLKTNLKSHEKPCRAVRFSEKGERVYSVSQDGSLAVFDVETSNEVQKIRNAHASGISSLCVLGNDILATGDNNGSVKVWDLRRQSRVVCWDHMTDYISSMVVDDARRTMVCSSGDGSITAYNLRARKKIVQCAERGNVPTALAIMDSDSKLTMASRGNGNPIYLYNWNEFGYHNDKLNGHPTSISCMAAVSDKVLVIGDDNGILRAAEISPHRFLGVVGIHMRDFGIKNLDVSPNNCLLASCGGDDQTVCFWNVEHILDMQKSLLRRQNESDFSNASEDCDLPGCTSL